MRQLQDCVALQLPLDAARDGSKGGELVEPRYLMAPIQAAPSPVDGPLHMGSSVICFLYCAPHKNKQRAVIDLAAKSARCYEPTHDS